MIVLEKPRNILKGRLPESIKFIHCTCCVPIVYMQNTLQFDRFTGVEVNDMLEENGIQNGHKLMSFYFFVKSIFENLHLMLSISLKLLETFLVFLFLKQGSSRVWWSCWALWILQVQNNGPPSIFLSAQPCQMNSFAFRLWFFP